MSDEQQQDQATPVVLMVCQMCGQAFAPIKDQRPFCSAECEGLWISELRRQQPGPRRFNRGGYP